MEFAALSAQCCGLWPGTILNYGVCFKACTPPTSYPDHPPTTVRANTDPAGEPGQHWLRLWIEQNKCEIFDSYCLPLHVYTNPELHQWWSQ